MIYFIQDTRTFEIKIGFTDGSAEARLSALQTGNPGELRLLYKAPGDYAREAELHRQFAADRVNGEWFRPSPNLLAYLIEEAHDDGTRSGYSGGLRDGRGWPNEWDNFQMVDGYIVETRDDCCRVYSAG